VTFISCNKAAAAANSGLSEFEFETQSYRKGVAAAPSNRIKSEVFRLGVARAREREREREREWVGVGLGLERPGEGQGGKFRAAGSKTA
jgi:hypothetical protein